MTGRPVPPRPLLVSVADDEWHGERGLGEDHLLECGVDFPPARRFLERASGKRPVANVGHGDLDGILVYRGVEPEHLRRNHNVLGKILGHPAAYHEEPGGRVLDLELSQFVKILGAVDTHLRPVAAGVLVGDEPEARRTIAEGWAKDRHLGLECLMDDALIGLAAVLLEIGPSPG